jgi:CheY-like chemotaxis protein
VIDPFADEEDEERVDFARVSALVVDDNIHMRRLVADILRAFGIGQVYEASDGAEALALMNTNMVEIVLCDWMMDKVTGIELLQEVRKPDTAIQFRRVAFIMMTAHDDEDRVWRAKEAGATALLVKPFSTSALYERLLSAAEGIHRKGSKRAFGTLDFDSKH